MQDQVRFLCQEIASVEWSGVLFYSTEGEFGSENFKCVAEELILMDIGSSAYTEYEFGEDFVGKMMKNPRLLKMKKGHIHSHNSMAVFFSGTDDGELRTNSEFHNIYLSLIVNNRNEMQAKLAFRATEKETVIEFRDDTGQLSVRSIPNDKPTLFVYNCAITKPGTPSGLEELAKDIETIRQKKEEERRSSYSSYGNSFQTSGQGHQTGFAQRWGSSAEQGQLAWEEEQETARKGNKGKTSSNGKTRGNKVPAKLAKFITMMLTDDEHTTTTIRKAITDLSASSYKDSDQLTKYLDRFPEMSGKYYSIAFPEDEDMRNFDETMVATQEVMDHFKYDFPNTSVKLVDAFNIVWENAPATEAPLVDPGDGPRYEQDGFDNSSEYVM